MLRCHDVSRLVASDEFLALTPVARMRVRLHWMMCRHCRRYARQVRAIGALARRLARDDEATAELDRLRSQILATLGGDRPPGTAASP